MPYDIAFVVLAGFASIVLLLMRTNVALAILGLCAGYVFSDVFSERLYAFLYNNNYTSGSLPIASMVSISLILLPALLIILRFRHYQKNRAIQHLGPILAFVILFLVLAINNLPLNYTETLASVSLVYGYLKSYELIIIAGVVLLSIFDILIFEHERKRQVTKLKKKHKKRHKD